MGKNTVTAAWEALRAYLSTPKLEPAMRAKALELHDTDKFLASVEATTRSAEAAVAQFDDASTKDEEESLAALEAAKALKPSRSFLKDNFDALEAHVEKLERESEAALSRARELEAKIVEVALPVDGAGRAMSPEDLGKALRGANLHERPLKRVLASMEQLLEELEEEIERAQESAELAIREGRDPAARAFLAEKREHQKRRVIARHHAELARQVLACLGALRKP